MTSFRITMESAQKSTESSNSRPMVKKMLPTRLPPGNSRMTFKGRMLAAWTIGNKPKIKAVTSPIKTPPPMMIGSRKKGIWMGKTCCTMLRTR